MASPVRRLGLAPFARLHFFQGGMYVKQRTHSSVTSTRARTAREWRRFQRGNKPPLLQAALLGACCALVLLLVWAMVWQTPVQDQALSSLSESQEESALASAIQDAPAQERAVPEPEAPAASSEAESSLSEAGEGESASTASQEEASAGSSSSFPEESWAASSEAAADYAISYYAPEEASLTEEEAAAKLESLRDTFPDGAYWNHAGVEVWDEFTVTDTPCEHDVYWDAFCNTYTGGLQELFPQYVPMEQCMGFAALLSDLVFGKEAPVSTFTDYTQLRVGDNIRLEYTEHSMVVLSVGTDGITVVECNSDYEHCRISWDRFLSWDQLAGYSYEMTCITRYEE